MQTSCGLLGTSAHQVAASGADDHAMRRGDCATGPAALLLRKSKRGLTITRKKILAEGKWGRKKCRRIPKCEGD